MGAVRNWFSKSIRAGPAAQAPPPEREAHGTETLAPVVARPLWPAKRLVTTDALWGEGYQFPGGEIEFLRLAKPLGLSPESNLLLLGAGSGGPPCSVASQLGGWIGGFEADPALAAAATDRIARRNLTKRAQIALWNPAAPEFRKNFFHHALALEPLRDGLPEPILAAIAQALKQSGGFVMTEAVADAPLDPTDPAVAVWSALERRDIAALQTEVAITRVLGRLGFEVRVVEDLSQRHIHQALAGWRTTVRGMENVRPTRREAMLYIGEAELWLFRLRLFQLGRLRLVRWHAIANGL